MTLHTPLGSLQAQADTTQCSTLLSGIYSICIVMPARQAHVSGGGTVLCKPRESKQTEDFVHAPAHAAGTASTMLGVRGMCVRMHVRVCGEGRCMMGAVHTSTALPANDGTHELLLLPPTVPSYVPHLPPPTHTYYPAPKMTPHLPVASMPLQL